MNNQPSDKAMRRMISWVLLLGVILSACSPVPIEAEEAQTKPIPARTDHSQRTIYLAAGCFWGVEAYYQLIPGILQVESGYANGDTEDTTYRQIGKTGHAEVVKIDYDSNTIHLAEILDRFYLIVDPLALNRQGNDVGTQYRSGIYYVTDEAKEIIDQSMDLFHERLGQTSYIEVEKLENYIPAEDYHQDYLANNPGAYCHVDLNQSKHILYPGIEKPSQADLKATLDSITYDVTQNAGTEIAHSSELNTQEGRGIYVDVITGQPLFSSRDKYDAGCGWPSFTKTITTDVIQYLEDRSHGMNRTEVQTWESGNHLGHVFNDGPRSEGGLRYCINGVSLRFISEEEMTQQGLQALLPYLMDE